MLKYMKAHSHLKPGQKGTRRLVEKYGDSLICVRYRYDVIGQTFIHVHHLLPLAIRDSQYQVDPIADLRPVCPNCHSMLHASDPPFSIEEIKELLNSAKADGPTRPVER